MLLGEIPIFDAQISHPRLVTVANNEAQLDPCPKIKSPPHAAARRSAPPIALPENVQRNALENRRLIRDVFTQEKPQFCLEKTR